MDILFFFFFFQAEDGIRDRTVTGVQTCALPIFLVVDDDHGVRENLAELFELVGYSVLTAANATEAMDALRKQEVDLLLTRSEERRVGKGGGARGWRAV